MRWPRRATAARFILAVAFRHGHPLDLDLTGAAIAFLLLHLDATFFSWSIDGGATVQSPARLSYGAAQQGLFRRM
jgi:hypothetical protein